MSEALVGIGLLLHFTGLALMVGTMLCDLIAYRRIWKHAAEDHSKALIVLEAIAPFPVLIGAGSGLLLVSGALLLIGQDGVALGATWFRIKLALVLATIINGIGIARPLGLRLHALLSSTGAAPGDLLSVRRRLNLFYGSQLALLAAILGLSAFN